MQTDRLNFTLWIGVAITSLLLSGCSEERPPAPAEQPESEPAAESEAGGTAIMNVSVIPMGSETLLESQTVIVRDGRIVSVSPTADTRISRDMGMIDGSGRFLAPGLADMHAHPMTRQDLNLFLANGITLIRSMWGEKRLLNMRERVESGEILGPRIQTAGRIVDGAPVIHYGSDLVTDAESAKSVVTRHRKAGYDWIKVYSNLTLESFDAIAATARGLDIPFAGHIPQAVPAEHAFRSGMQTFEHLTGVADAIRREGVDIPARWDPSFDQLAEAIARGDTTFDDLYDADKMANLANLAAETGIWVVPTLVVLRGIGLAPEQMQVEMSSDAYAHMSYPVQGFWKFLPFSSPGRTAETFAGLDRFFRNDISQLGAFHRAGARILAGTDAPNPWVYTGFSLVHELELFVEAGMSPYEAIATATTNVGEFLGEAGETGIVQPGARADLVLLRANPLEDVAAYRQIDSVFIGGQYLGRKRLDSMLAGVRRKADTDMAVFGGSQSDWPLETGEQVGFHAEFRLLENGEPAGAERIATVIGADGTATHLGHSIAADGAESTARVPAGQSALSGTGADWLNIAGRIRDMTDGESRTLEATGPGGESLEINVTRYAATVIPGHFYWSGCNPHDITISGADWDQSIEFCAGGGFYNGWPIRIEVTEGETTTTWKRFF